jgi:hypothetical protein
MSVLTKVTSRTPGEFRVEDEIDPGYWKCRQSAKKLVHTPPPELVRLNRILNSSQAVEFNRFADGRAVCSYIFQSQLG